MDAYAAMNFIAKPVIERQINKNQEAHATMADWDFRAAIPERAEMSYPLEASTKLQFTASEGAGMALIKLKAKSGNPRSLTLNLQDYLGDPEARQQFFAGIPQTEYH